MSKLIDVHENDMMAPPALKTLFVLPGLEAGGAERVLITLMNNLDRARFQPHLVSVKGTGPLHDLIADHVQFHPLDQSFKPPLLLSLYKTLRSVKPDIVIATMTHMNFAVLLLKPLFPKTRFIVREAITPSFFLDKYPKKRRLLSHLYKFLYPKAHIILSPTSKVLDELIHLIGLKEAHISRNFIVLKNPIQIQKIRDNLAIQPPNHERKDTVHYVACGRLHVQKGFDRLIETIALNRSKMPTKWHLDILGEGEDRENLENLITSHHLSAHIYLRGLIMPPHSYFAAADCFLLPSRHEGLPNVVLESLACGTSVIATAESGGIAEIAEDCEADAVKICKNMDEFITAVCAVQPDPIESPRPSLLARCYHDQHIFKKFEDILISAGAK